MQHVFLNVNVIVVIALVSHVVHKTSMCKAALLASIGGKVQINYRCWWTKQAYAFSPPHGLLVDF